jgi:hypothetical protein
MRKKTPAGPCRTLSAEQCTEVEKQMRDAGRLRTVSEVELSRGCANANRSWSRPGQKTKVPKPLRRSLVRPIGRGSLSDFRAITDRLRPTLAGPTGLSETKM